MLAEKQYHVDVREGKIYLYYWVKQHGRDHLIHKTFTDWNQVWDFVR